MRSLTLAADADCMVWAGALLFAMTPAATYTSQVDYLGAVAPNAVLSDRSSAVDPERALFLKYGELRFRFLPHRPSPSPRLAAAATVVCAT